MYEDKFCLRNRARKATKFYVYSDRRIAGLRMFSE